jgi:hypothetical protein
MSNIKINKPCTEDWNEMTPKEKGRFCSKCTKVVQDFRQSTQQEIVRHVTSSVKTCGRFYKHQLVDFKQQKEWRLFRRFAFAILIAFGSTLFTVNTALAQEKISSWKTAFSIEKDGIEKTYDYVIPGIVLDAHSTEPVAFAKVFYLKKDGYRLEIIANDKGKFELKLNKEDIGQMKEVMLYAGTDDSWYYGHSERFDFTEAVPEKIEINMFYEEIMGDEIEVDPEDWDEIKDIK